MSLSWRCRRATRGGALPSSTLLGPTLSPLELAGRKLLALFGRADARDFADVYVLAQRFGNQPLLEQAQALDAGFDIHVLAQMIGTINRFQDDEIPLPANEHAVARSQSNPAPATCVVSQDICKVRTHGSGSDLVHYGVGSPCWCRW